MFMCERVNHSIHYIKIDKICYDMNGCVNIYTVQSGTADTKDYVYTYRLKTTYSRLSLRLKNSLSIFPFFFNFADKDYHHHYSST